MPKEGEGNVTNELQDVTGQGKEIEGIKYPYPAPYILAFMEDEFGSLEDIAKNPTRHAYGFSMMLVSLLELQKNGTLKEIAGMSKAERRKACCDILDEKKITTQDFMGARGRAANEVFLNALGVIPKKLSKLPNLAKKKSLEKRT